MKGSLALAQDGARDSREAVRCVACNQVIAYFERDGHFMTIQARTWVEKNGKRRVECPVCKARTTVDERRAA